MCPEDKIGRQCLMMTFSKNFRPRAERVARVSLAARARPDGRNASAATHSRVGSDSIAFLNSSEYKQMSTSAGVI